MAERASGWRGGSSGLEGVVVEVEVEEPEAEVPDAEVGDLKREVKRERRWPTVSPGRGQPQCMYGIPKRSCNVCELAQGGGGW